MGSRGGKKAAFSMWQAEKRKSEDGRCEGA